MSKKKSKATGVFIWELEGFPYDPKRKKENCPLRCKGDKRTFMWYSHKEKGYVDVWHSHEDNGGIQDSSVTITSKKSGESFTKASG